MSEKWWSSREWNDADTESDADGTTHRCRVCDHGARIQTPQRRTEHYCRECDAWQRFESTLSDSA